MLYILLSFLSLFFTPAWASKVEVDLFPVGQGNAVMVRYKPTPDSPHQSMLIDAGSREMRFPAIYHKKATQEKIPFRLLPRPEGGPSQRQGSSPHMRKAVEDHAYDSGETSSNDPASGPDSDGDRDSAHPDPFSGKHSSSAAPAGGGKYRQKRTRGTYEEHVIESIRDKLHIAEENRLHLKTLVISHADEDHYNLVHKIFSGEVPFHIEHLVLGGLHDEYNETFKTWLQKNSGSFGRKPIFTGRADGGEGRGIQAFPNGYARSYFSGMVEDSKQLPVETAVENALKWDTPADDLLPPRFEILSMNAGHADQPTPDGLGIARRANPNKNANSLVLRLSTPLHSVLLTGDAELPTWEHIETHKILKPEKSFLTDYVLLSHHGSKEEGATPIDFLEEAFKPKACFISAGRHKKYGHPALSTVRGIQSLGTLFHTETSHPISYFSERPRAHKRTHTTRALFSTLNNGHLSFDLNEEVPTIYSSQRKDTTYTDPITSQKFSVDHNEVYLPEEGTDIEDLIASLEANLGNMVVWERTAEKEHIRQTREIISGDPDQPPKHLLIDRGKLYFLNPFIESEEDIPTPSSPADGQKPQGGNQPARQVEEEDPH